MVGLSVLLVGGVGGLAPWEASDSRMARANPFIIFQGYRLRSEDVVPTGFVCDGWLHRSCSQCRRSKLVAKVVGFGVHCPNLHWSKWMRLSPSACNRFLGQPMAQILEHLCADGELEHCAGSSGCSKNEAGGDAPCALAPS